MTSAWMWFPVSGFQFLYALETRNRKLDQAYRNLIKDRLGKAAFI